MIRDRLTAAVAHHRAGRLREAEVLYRQVLSDSPDHPDALHLLGALAQQSGRAQEAYALMSRALAVAPPDAQRHNNLALVCHSLGRLNEALAHLRSALELDPAHADAAANLCAALTERGELDAAIDAGRRAVEAHGRHLNAHVNLANALALRGRIEEAGRAYAAVLAIDPNHIDALGNLAWAHEQLGRDREVEPLARRALQRHPGHVNASTALALVLQRQGRLDEAIEVWRAAAELNPRHPELLNNLAGALCQRGEARQALDTFARAMEAAPHVPQVHSNYVYTMHFLPEFDAAAVLAAHREWDRRHAQPLRAHIRPHQNDRDPDRRLRIGYVSGDFVEHPVGRGILPLLAHHDRTRYEVYCYSDVRREDDITARLRRGADAWRETRELSHEALAARIRDDRVDVLLDLTLHMAGTRLPAFARKPAPVQATFIGYPATSGVGAIDYRITDAYLDPPGESEPFNSETLLRLPNSFWCYDGDEAVEPGSLPALDAGCVTFGSLNNPIKMSDPTLRLWAQVLAAVPASRLLTLASERSPHLLERFARHGIAADRLEVLTWRPRAQYLRAYCQVDIGLDLLPYNGHMTSCDSLWMGVPVVSLRGGTSVGRAGHSLLANVGLPELLARTPQQFVDIATALAADLPRLAELRSTLRQRMRASPLCDQVRFARDVETAYRQMWHIWCGLA